ncbi:preprotein translocase subunit SecA [Franzmannia qiaohouensis]|uniref:Preprotein translocase subunit SecA n=1 Tax=Franzmannia qiaohouensis TaxID=1329370 RepID=A0ABU1HIT5_9GAMM|nr:preprotein translocase subunit SecA [Halomonas qiaohouensis]MDR5907398.1 preprotein translocase subunit SecA [Halomonas qiaohouensis]
MSSLKLPRDVMARPERQQQAPTSLEKPWNWLRARLTRPSRLRRWSMRLALVRIHRHARVWAGYDESHFDAELANLRMALIQRGLSRALALNALAAVREAAGRELGMWHHDVQLLGGLAMLDGHIAEMHTGEGKTLTATLPAAAVALAGTPVHIITVNDYLAARDAELMTPVYRRLGLEVAAIVHDMTPAERRQAYAADVVYCTNKELVFDYLRDSQVLGRFRQPMLAHAARLRGDLAHRKLLLRGLHFAIVDEADSVMLDEARTPLILSGPAPQDAFDIALIDQVNALAGTFVEGIHFVKERGQLHLTDAGKQRLTEQSEQLMASRQAGAGWVGRSRREWLIQQALVARHQFQRDQHYLVRDGKVQIIDEHTGRVMADRSWEKGLQQMIERLEGCEPSDPNVTLARLTYQRFFRRYHQLAGMTGTAREVRQELWTTYRRRVVAIPPHRPSKRRMLGTICVADRAEKWRWIATRARQLANQQRAVLVATVSLADAEALSAALHAGGIAHAMLSARQDAEEAEVIARAGTAGTITVATSMAGRGTDIALDETAKAAGGLHVIVAGHHDASRVDRQIAGRSARQGDPGSVEFVVAEDDALLEELQEWRRHMGKLPSRLQRAQAIREARHARERARLLSADWRESELLGFSGRGE